MSPFLQLILLLALLILAAKAAGYLVTLVGQPSVLGELVMGLILGPSLLDIYHWPMFSEHLLPETIQQLGEIGVLLLMFVAGLELHMTELARSGRVAALAGIFGVVIPAFSGFAVGRMFGFDVNPAIFLGLTLGATSVSISAQTLMELNVLRSRVGLGLLGAAVFDDILVILFFSGFLALAGGGQGYIAIGLLFLRMVLFLGLSAGFGLWILPRIVRKISHLPISQSVLSLALIVLFLYGVAAEVVGSMAAITGTFLAGLMFARSPEKERLESGVSAIAYGFFVPIFFINIGLSVNARQLEPSVIWLFVGISSIAIFGKLIGAGAGARLAGFSWREAAQLGAGMVSRGEVGLILASVGIEQGLMNQGEFSAIIGMILVTTLITPPMLRALFAKPKGTFELVMKSEKEEEIA